MLLITQRYLERAQAELQALREKCARLKKGLGGAVTTGSVLAKIPGYTSMEEQVAFMEAVIRETESELGSAEVIDPVSIQDDVVSVLSIVTVSDPSTGNVAARYYFEGIGVEVGGGISMVTQGSPMGRALLGRKVGDVIQVGAQRKSVRHLRIDKIEMIELT